VEVVVEDIDADKASIATSSELKTSLELRLRKEGIRVYTQEEMTGDPRRPYLYLNVNMMNIDGTREIGTMDLSLNQLLWTVTNGKLTQACYAVTWHTNAGVFCWGDLIVKQHLSDKVESMMDEFVNAWLATHTKK